MNKKKQPPPLPDYENPKTKTTNNGGLDFGDDWGNDFSFNVTENKTSTATTSGNNSVISSKPAESMQPDENARSWDNLFQ